MPELWAGLDAGKAHHHCAVIDADGAKQLSRKVPNNEPELLELLGDVLALDEHVTWAIDLNSGGAALIIALLINHNQRLLYIPGRTVHYASGAYRGAGKTDAKDAYLIADQARMRRDLRPLQPGDEIAVDLGILTARRYDLAADRTRAINRLRAQMLEYFPALERAFDYSQSQAALVLLTGYQTPAALRRLGLKRLTTWLRNRRVRGADDVASRALAAAQVQHTTLPGETLAASVVARLATEIRDLDKEIAETDALIQERFRQHQHAPALLSMPGIGPLLGAEFIGLTGGDMTIFGTPDRLAGVAGLAPVPRDSGRISGNLRRPYRYNRRLLRVFYLAAQVAAQHCPVSRQYYQRKRSEGKNHKQAVLALARRRLNVLWALLRDGRTFERTPPISHAAAA